jgi:hypothetical protein
MLERFARVAGRSDNPVRSAARSIFVRAVISSSCQPSNIAVRCRDFGRRPRKSRDRRLWGYGQPAQLGRNPPPKVGGRLRPQSLLLHPSSIRPASDSAAEQFAPKVCARIVVDAPCRAEDYDVALALLTDLHTPHSQHVE